jgi:hypothetical protein
MKRKTVITLLEHENFNSELQDLLRKQGEHSKKVLKAFKDVEEAQDRMKAAMLKLEKSCK